MNRRRRIRRKLSWTASAALAISTSLRAAVSGLAKWLGSMNFADMAQGHASLSFWCFHQSGHDAT
jgi:hypothetical protein